MDIYGIIRLCKPIVKTEDVVTDTKISTSNSSGNLSSIASGVTSGKTQPDGSYVTSTRKITSVRSQEGMKFEEFPWREHAVFRFPLPEGQISLPTNYKLGKQYRPKLAGGKMPGFAERKLEDTDCVTPPKNLQISIFERTFFSDNKLGDIDLPLSNLTEDKPFREWLPLSTDRGGAWFVNLQAQIHFNLMTVDALSPRSTGPTTLKTISRDKPLSSFFTQAEDLF